MWLSERLMVDVLIWRLDLDFKAFNAYLRRVGFGSLIALVVTLLVRKINQFCYGLLWPGWRSIRPWTQKSMVKPTCERTELTVEWPRVAASEPPAPAENSIQHQLMALKQLEIREFSELLFSLQLLWHFLCFLISLFPRMKRSLPFYVILLHSIISIFKFLHWSYLRMTEVKSGIGGGYLFMATMCLLCAAPVGENQEHVGPTAQYSSSVRLGWLCLCLPSLPLILPAWPSMWRNSRKDEIYILSLSRRTSPLDYSLHLFYTSSSCFFFSNSFCLD